MSFRRAEINMLSIQNKIQRDAESNESLTVLKQNKTKQNKTKQNKTKRID
jgi:hypothetical protein